MSIEDYISEHSSAEPQYLQQIYRDTYIYQAFPHMVSGHIQGRVLSMLSHMIHPKRILELGTFTAYSALCLAEGLSEDGLVHTIEKNEELETCIRHNLSLTELGKKVVLHIGDALDIIPQLDEKFDLVFMDADKREYAEYYNAIIPFVIRGGWILVDNTLWDGHIIDKSYDRDNQTISLRAFNNEIANDERVEKVILPIRDGLTLIRVK